MATYSAGVALAFDYEVANGTTGSYTPGGDDRAVFGTIACGNFGGLPTIDELRYGGSTGTVITRIGTDLTCFGGNGSHGIFGIAPGPTGSTTLFGDWTGTPLQSAIAAIHYSGVDQTTPFSGAVDATPTLVGGVTTTVASVTVTGCTAGQTILAAVTGLSDNVSLSAFTAVSGTTLRVSDVTGTFCGIAMLEKVATGSSETLSVNVNCSSSAGLYWTARGARVNDAAGGGTTHPSTGSLVADAATVSGTAARTRAHPSTGALVADAATVSGTATHLNQHPSTGALAAQSATVAGTAARTRQHPSTGSLVADAATVAGTATRFRAHPSTGSLVAQDAVVAGDATVTPAAGPHLTTGVLEAQAATVAGDATVTHIAPVFVFDGHDGGKEPKKKQPDFKQYKEAKARLRKQIESAFQDEEPAEIKEVKKQAEKVLAEVVSKQDIAKAIETIKLLESALESAQDEEDLLNILL